MILNLLEHAREEAIKEVNKSTPEWFLAWIEQLKEGK